ncbi:hypothetical protein BD309DRAFT_958540 [Dichomitus squalens]|nr:hypothetical protein BD309DRAFT_958540 [Dichomitus squalens]
MPHPSNPVDDTSARSYNREHGRLVRSRGRLVHCWHISSELYLGGPASWAYV